MAVFSLILPAGGHSLVIGTGTGDLCLDFVRHKNDAGVIGIDPADEMLAIGRSKVSEAGLSSQIDLQSGDATKLPFEANRFDGIVTGFCIRNVEDRLAALREMHRVLKPGGRTVILELTTPTNPIMSAGHKAFTYTFIPLVARLMSKGSAYKYLRESINAFPPLSAFEQKLEQAGFDQPVTIPLAGGAAAIFIGTK
jgi:demethylmenaquinone methyltransferase/2-methoxy-6-polyprenyl-1,4-benzoquinol methylase